MAMYKLNKLVLQLTSNEGWRIEIDGLPELTEVGSRRQYSENEEDALYPAFGSGPCNDTSGSGFYSKADYEMILEVAAQNHIEIIPCILMPGQCHAAIVSMNKRYKCFMANNDLDQAQEYLLVDRESPMTEENQCNYKLSLLDPRLNSTYKFIEHVIDSLTTMHQTTQPLKLVYIGGYGLFHDTLAKPESFEPFKKTDETLNIFTTFHEYFMHRIASMCWHNHGIKLGVHANAVLTNLNNSPIKSSILPLDAVIVFATNTSTDTITLERAYKLANAGYQVIISHGAHLFFDHAQEPDPEERGLVDFVRYIDDKTIFAFKPDDIYSNCKTDETSYVVPNIDITVVCEASVKLLKPDKIIGIQAYLYTDLIHDITILHSQVFPRLLPFAERAWHKADWEINGSKDLFEKDWEEFANVVGYKELARLRKNKIMYRIPPPGVVCGQDIKLCSLYPGFHYMYRKISDKPCEWKEINSGDSLPRRRDRYEFVTVDSVDQRKSKIIQEAKRIKPRKIQKCVVKSSSKKGSAIVLSSLEEEILPYLPVYKSTP